MTTNSIQFNSILIDPNLIHLLEQQDRLRFRDTTTVATNSNGDRIIEIARSEAIVMIAKEDSPRLETSGCGPCMAVAGFEPNNKITFLVHFSIPEEVHCSGQEILDKIYCLAEGKRTSSIQIHLRGRLKNMSEPLFRALQDWIRSSRIPMDISSQTILDSKLYDHNGTLGRSLAIDPKTGDVSECSPSITDTDIYFGLL